MKKFIKHHAKRFSLEFKKTIDTALYTASGIIIAGAWKGVLDEWLGKIISPISGKIISALLITGICVIGIYTIRSFTK